MLQIMSWGFPQLLMAYFVQRLKTRKWLTVAAAAADRLANTGIWLSVALLPVIGPRWSLVMLFASMAAGVPLIGLTTTAWQDLLGRIIPQGTRGRFFGLVQSVGTVAAVGSAALVGWLLPGKGAITPEHYAPPLLAGAVVLWTSVGLLSLTREAPYPVSAAPESLRGFWRKMYRRFRTDEALRTYIYARIIDSGSAVFSMSLLADYARREFGVSERAIAGAFGVLLFAPQVAASPLAGWLGDKVGFRRLIAGAAFSGTLALLVALSLPLWGARAVWGFYAVCVVMGIGWAAGGVGHQNMVYEYGDVEDRPAVMALTAGIPSIFLVAAIGAGGLLVDSIGETALIALALAYIVAATACYAFLMKEPPGESPAGGLLFSAGPARRTRGACSDLSEHLRPGLPQPAGPALDAAEGPLRP
jgi:MFS family permease